MLKKCELGDYKEVAGLALLLWPDHELQELQEELKNILLCKEASIFFVLC